MAQIVVGVADLRVCANPEDVLITYSLGSCIGMLVYDPNVPVAGLLHYMLPRASVDSKKAEKNPAMFGDVGIPMLFNKIYEAGGSKNRLVVKMAGGAQILDDGNLFDIGKRNHTIARKLLWKNNILIGAEDVGGNNARTMKFSLKDGLLTIRSRGQEVAL